MKIATVLFVLAFAAFGLTQATGAPTRLPGATPGRIVIPPSNAVAQPQRSFTQPIPLVSTFGGKFVFSISISIKSTLPTSDVIECVGSASTFDGGRVISESAGVAATRAGATATCAPSIPYSWMLAASSTDMVSLSYSILVPVTGPSALPNRNSTQGLVPIHVPPTGSTTTETISATI